MADASACVQPARTDWSVTSGTRTVHSVPTSVVVTPQRKAASRISVGKVVARADRRATVVVRPSVTGEVRVSVRAGGRTLSKTVMIKAGRRTTVTVGTLPKRASGRAVVTVRLKPQDWKAYASSSRTKAVPVRR